MEISLFVKYHCSQLFSFENEKENNQNKVFIIEGNPPKWCHLGPFFPATRAQELLYKWPSTGGQANCGNWWFFAFFSFHVVNQFTLQFGFDWIVILVSFEKTFWMVLMFGFTEPCPLEVSNKCTGSGSRTSRAGSTQVWPVPSMSSNPSPTYSTSGCPRIASRRTLYWSTTVLKDMDWPSGL